MPAGFLATGTQIGSSFKGRPRPLAIASVVALVVVAVDVFLSWTYAAYYVRVGPALAAVALYMVLARGDRAALGLRLTPVQGLRFWVVVTLVLGAAMIGFIVVGLIVLRRVLGEIPHQLINPPTSFGRFFQACVAAPVTEEAIYRLVLCVPAVALIRPWGAIIFSGIAFAALHFVYGNPGLDNFIAGYLLAWVYLKSGSIVVPIVLHGAGNLVILSTHLVVWHLVHG